MSLTEPPPQDESELDRPPSRRFKILFTLAMVVIAAGYMWVWQEKTSRTVAESPPGLVLAEVTSSVPGHDAADEAAIRDSVAAGLRTVPGLVLSRSVEDAAPTDTIPGRPVPLIYALRGALDRDPDGRYSLELRRIDARTDSVVYIYGVHGSTLPEVVHRMAVQVAMSFGLPRPARDTVPAPSAGDPAVHTGTGR
ncbi:MAG TPA: hypothetical protein VHG09_09375 [Longimicrobiales bacterium]|nr:hypothetical protein [Longimicrobiales bacterium]